MLAISLGVETGKLKTGIAEARAAIDELKRSASGKGLFASIESQLGTMRGKFTGVFQNISSGNFLGALAGAEGMGIAMGGLAVGLGGVTAAAMGMWSAMSKGKELTMLADQTNLTIPQLMTLEKVVGKVGMSMEDMPQMMGHFNSAMQELSNPASKVSEALGKIGLNAASFQGKSYYEGLKTLAKGMGEATNATDKMAAAQAIFGARKGNLMMPILKEGAFTKAEATTSPVAQVFEQYGAVFAQFQAAVARLSLTLTPFFAGMASEIVPGLLKAVEGFQKLDLSETGRSFGKAIAGVGTVIESIVNMVDSITSKLQKVVDTHAKSAPAYQAAIGGGFGGGIGLGMTGGGVGLSDAMKKAKDIAKEEGPAVAKDLMNKTKEPGATIDTGTPKAQGLLPMIVSSFTKIGAGGTAFGGGGGDAMMNIQREQLAVQQRMAAALERQLANERQTGMAEATTTPLLGN